MKDKKQEVQDALAKLGYAFGFVSRAQIHDLDVDRALVKIDGCMIGIYDFVKHTFVD